MRSVIFAVVTLLSLPGARAETQQWDLKLNFHMNIPALLGMAAVASADVAFATYDLCAAAKGTRVPTWLAITEVAVATPQAILFWARAVDDNEPIVYGGAIFTTALALHGLVTPALPAGERPVTVAPTFVAGAPGVGVSGLF